MRVSRLLFAVVVLLFAHEAVMACSVCRCGDQSFFLNNARQLSAGRFLFSVEHFNTRKSAALHHHEDEHDLAKALSPFQGQHGEPSLESQAQNVMQLNVKYGLTSRLTLMASAPYTFNRLSSSAGTETANGLGDPEVTALAQVLEIGNGTWLLQVAAGARVPLGASDQKDEAGARLEQHLQTGSGAWAGTFSLQLMRNVGAVPLFFGASYQANGTNDHEFAYGNVFRFNVAAQRALANAFDLIAEVNGRAANHDQAATTVDENSGGTVVYFSPGLRLRFGGAFSLRSQVQIPIAENLHGEQDEKVNVRTGFVWEF